MSLHTLLVGQGRPDVMFLHGLLGQGRNWPLGAALSISLTAIVMLSLIVYVRASSKTEVRHG